MILFALVAAAATPSAADLEALAAGDVVLHDLTPTRAGAIRCRAFVDVHASQEATWAALVDFSSRKAGNASLKSMAPYKAATATEQWIRWEASRFGVSVVYHNHYLLSPGHDRLVHDLDASRPNDLVYSRGEFNLGSDATCSGCTRLSYEVESDFGLTIPSAVKSWLTGSGVRDFLRDIARRAAAR